MDEATQKLKETEDACRAAMGDIIYGQNDETLQEVVGSTPRMRERRSPPWNPARAGF